MNGKLIEEIKKTIFDKEFNENVREIPYSERESHLVDLLTKTKHALENQWIVGIVEHRYEIMVWESHAENQRDTHVFRTMVSDETDLPDKQVIANMLNIDYDPKGDEIDVLLYRIEESPTIHPKEHYELSKERFQSILETFLKRDGINPNILTIPGIYENLSEHYNNEVIETFNESLNIEDE